MGEAFRVFLVGDDNSLRRLPLRLYERMLKADPKESIPEYAGKRLCYALVFLEVFERKPVEVIQIQYSYLSFDGEGKIDQSEFEKQARLAMEAIDTSDSKRQNGRIVFARQRFTEKRMRDQYHWTPDPALEATIVKAAFGKV